MVVSSSVSRQAKGDRWYGRARKPARALAALRRCMTECVELPFDEGLVIEWEEAVALGAAADFREGLDAFLGRRPPVWSD